MRTHNVGRKAPNELNIHDMSGNVWEWCWDMWDNSYPIGSHTNPSGQTSGNVRVLRGGSWFNAAVGCMVRMRFADVPTNKGITIEQSYGFRVCRISID